MSRPTSHNVVAIGGPRRVREKAREAEAVLEKEQPEKMEHLDADRNPLAEG